MNVSYQWLSEYLDLTDISPEDLADKMSRTGIEVEDVFVPETARVVFSEIIDSKYGVPMEFFVT